MTETATAHTPEVALAQQATFADVPLGQITPDSNQPRKVFDPIFLAELAESIRENGVIQPIVIRPSPAGADGQLHICPYTIVAGETRWRASAIAGRQTIPAIIRRDLSEGDIVVMQVLENLQRRDLSLIETCEGVTRLVQQMGFDKAVAQLGKSKTWVSRHSTLTELPHAVLDLVKAGKVESVDVAKDLAQLMELSPKKGGEMVGRLAGTLNVYGNPVQPDDDADDPELTEEERAEALESQQRVMRPPTRADIRQVLGFAKDEHERKEVAKAARVQLSEDPAANKLKEQARKSVEKEKAARERHALLKKEVSDAELTHTTALCAHLGLPPAKRDGNFGWSYQSPVVVRGPNLYYTPGSSMPAFDKVNFSISFRNVGADLLAKAYPRGLKHKAVPQFLNDARLTLDECLAIEKLLGPKRVVFAVGEDATGAELLRAVARFDHATAKANAEAGVALNAALKKRGIKTSPAQSSIEEFLEVGIVEKIGARIKSAELHAAYVAWCQGQKLEALPLNGASNAFGAAIESWGIQKIRSNGIHYTGIALA